MPRVLEGFIIGVLSAGIVLAIQIGVDEGRINREHEREDRLNAQAIRLENLRFVRALSSETYVPRPFRGLDLSGLELSGLDLGGADLQKANLTGAVLRDTNLVGADLSGAILDKADLTSAELMGVTLRSNSMNGTILTDTNLSGSEITFAEVDEQFPPTDSRPADWGRAILTGALVQGADFSQTHFFWDQAAIGTTFRFVDLSHVGVSGPTGSSPNLGIRFCGSLAEGVAPFADPDGDWDAVPIGEVGPSIPQPTASHESCDAVRTHIDALVTAYLAGGNAVPTEAIDLIPFQLVEELSPALPKLYCGRVGGPAC